MQKVQFKNRSIVMAGNLYQSASMKAWRIQQSSQFIQAVVRRSRRQALTPNCWPNRVTAAVSRTFSTNP